MDENITIDKAISKGHKMVSYPILIILIVSSGINLYLVKFGYIPEWTSLIGTFLAIFLGWLWWSIMITKWRLWAYKNVSNLYELEKRAIREKLIWSNKSIFEKTEIRTAINKAILNSLKNKSKQEVTFQDDLDVPSESIIYYSRSKNFIEMALKFIGVGFGLYLIFYTDNYIVGSLFSSFGLYSTFKEYKESTNTNPQIIINDKGIQTKSTKFISWNEIKNEEVIYENLGRNTHYYLVYDYKGGKEHLPIDDYDTDSYKLNRLLVVYRGRSKTKTTNR